MTAAQDRHNINRQAYIERLRKARNNFLKVFYEDTNPEAIPLNVDLLSVLVVQNMEILDILRRISCSPQLTDTKGED